MSLGRFVPVQVMLAVSLALGMISLLVGTPTTSAATPAGTSGVTFRVYAHREGLVGGTTANGHVIQPNDHFVALPCACALSSKDGNEFQVKIEYNGKTATAPVWDVGPWNIDDNYWDPPSQRTWPNLPQGVPEAAAAFNDHYNDGRDGKGREVRSPAGMDIGDGTFADLGMTDSDWVTVTFLWTTPAHPSLEELPTLPDGYQDVPTIYYGERPPLDPVDAVASDDSSYFPETGHNVPAPFMAYWNEHGSWRNIGLPISELYRQVSFDGAVRIIQYFERQVLELNLPATDGKPLVTSSLIGYTASAPASATAKIPPFQSSDNSWYFPETNHKLANGFLTYWQQHGGLAAFGFPISEEYSGVTPDGRTYVAQIFERARFEWWPDKAGTPGEITQGLLGVELLRRDGWPK